VTLVDRIWSYIGDDGEGDGPVERLRRYYAEKPGRRFDTLSGGGDRDDTRDSFEADDIVAVALLSVDIPPKAILTILESKRKGLSKRLRGGVNGDPPGVPVNTNLWEADESMVEVGSPADLLWHDLNKIPGIGWVTAGKLLARKRPQLIPVFDRVIRACLMPTDSDTWWVSLREALRDDPEIVTRLGYLKSAAELPAKVSLLRVLDVAVWMTSQDPDGRAA
jgi:hypothetical protein